MFPSEESFQAPALAVRAHTCNQSQHLKSWHGRVKSSRSSLVTQLRLRPAWATWWEQSGWVTDCQGWFAWSRWLGSCPHPYRSVSASSHGFPHRRGSFFGVKSGSYCSSALLLGPPVMLSWSCLILTCHGAPQLRYFRGPRCSWHHVLTAACQAPSVASAALCLIFWTWSDFFFSEPVSVP